MVHPAPRIAPVEEAPHGRARTLPAPPPPPGAPVEPPSPAEQLAHRMQALPAPASRTALLALTERDLPTTDGLAPPDLVFQEPAISDTLLALRTALGHHPGVFVSGYTAVYDVAPDGAGRCGWCPTCWSPSQSATMPGSRT